jgi:peptidoglycan-associated lipoprotein
MKMRMPLKVAVAAALLMAFLLEGCGGKRPPAVTEAEAARRRAASSQTAGSDRARAQPVDAGPDLRQLSSDRAEGTDFAVSDESGEGGPLEDVRFDFDQATISQAGHGILERNAAWLQSHRQAKVLIEGHCDERGTVEYNLALGEQRAKAARDSLVGLGVAAERLRTVSYGKERPLDPASSETAWAKNRRAHFVVTR